MTTENTAPSTTESTPSTSSAAEFVKSVATSAPPVKTAGKGKKMAEVAAKAAKGAKKVATKTQAKTAAKKTATKTAPKTPKAPGAPRGHSYQLVSEKKLPEKLSPQGAFIIDFLRKGPATKATIAAAAAKNPKAFPCTQPHDRAVGFYLSKFKNLNALDFAKV